MNITEAVALHKAACQHEVEVRARKAHDYSTDKNVFANFEIVPAICKAFADAGIPIDITTPTGYCTLMVILKLARIQNLIHRDVALNESLGDSILDARVYLEIIREILIGQAIEPNDL